MIKTFLKNALRVVSAFWFYSLVLVLALCALVWWTGPRLALDDWHPWHEPAARLLSIALIMLTWAAVMGLRYWLQVVRRQRGQDPVGAVAYEKRQAQRAAIADMRLRFRAAQKRLSGGWRRRARSTSWRQSLPWFLLLGQPASGKTSLLEYSGLELPLNRRADILERPPTRTAGVEWYFAEGGVVLDTAGGLLTHEDAKARYRWQALLKLLSQKRRGRPLNGVVACLTVSTLLDENPAPLQAFAIQLSARLQEIHQQLRCAVPVYLVLTHADALRGFETFFCDVGETEKQQVLGVGVTEGEHNLDGDLLDNKFGTLGRHLHSQLIQRLKTERDAKRLARIIAFPEQLNALLNPLKQLIELTFAGNRYQPAIPLMGVYLTAAPHWHGPVDMPVPSLETAAITEGASTAAEVAKAKNAVHRKSEPGKPEATQALGSSRFITQIFSGVVFARAGLARLTPDALRRHALFQVGKVLGLLAVAGWVTAIWVYAWRDAYTALEHVSVLGQQLNTARREAIAGDDPASLLPRLDSSYAATQVFSSSSHQWLHHTGLWQGNKSGPVLEHTYQDELDQHLLPAIGGVLKDELRGSLENHAQLRQSLRLYLMLKDRKHRDNGQLREHLLNRWAARYPEQHTERARLSHHLDRLLRRPFEHSLDDRLVSQARQHLRATQSAQVLYEAVKHDARGLPDFRFNRHLDRQGLLFSGTDHVIPGLYTREGYQQYFSGKGLELAQHSLRDGWVLEGADLPDPGHLRRLMVEVEGLYLNDYAHHWGEALGSIALLPLDNAAHAAEQASALTAPDSPLVKLLNEVRDNTRLTLPSALASANQVPQVGGSAVINAAQEAVAMTLPDRARRGLSQRFADLHRLLEEDGGPSPDLIAVLQALNSLQLQVGTLERASQPDHAAFELAKGRMAGGPDGFTALQKAAARVPMPMRNWLMDLADDTWQQVLEEAYIFVNRRYQEELFKPYEQRIARRFPFKDNTEREVEVLDFQAFFKRDGMADSFYDKYLKPFAIEGEHRLRVVDGHSLPVSPHTLRQLGKVRSIQSSFFADTSDQLGISFRLQPYSLDAAVGRATFTLGDTQLEYRHGPIMTKEFHWPVTAENGVARLVTERFDGKAVGFEETAGAWSLFRLLGRMESEPHRGRDMTILKAEIAGARVNYVLSTRQPNPFDTGTLRGFALPMAL